MVGVPLNGKQVEFAQLLTELAAAGITLPNALGSDGTDLFTYDTNGLPTDLPAGASAVLAAHAPSTALKDQLVNALQSCVGVAIVDLTNAQRLAIVAGLLYKAGGLNRQGQVRPLNQWLV